MCLDHLQKDSLCCFLTVSTHEVGEEGFPGLNGKHRVVVGEMIEGDQSVFRVPEDHQHLCNT